MTDVPEGNDTLPTGPADSSAATKAKPREWLIEVCATCGRHAVWPFCAHRPEGYEPDPAKARWTELVRVREVSRVR